MPGEASGVALGLPLPPSAGKRRLVVSIVSPSDIRLDRSAAFAEVGRRRQRRGHGGLRSIVSASSRFGIQWKHGYSAVWRGASLTGLDYVTDRSDLDLLLDSIAIPILIAWPPTLPPSRPMHPCGSMAN